MKKIILLHLITSLTIIGSAQQFENVDTIPLNRLSGEALDSTLFKFVPKVEYGDLMQVDGSTSFTTEYQPSGSSWGPTANEEDVYLGRLKSNFDMRKLSLNFMLPGLRTLLTINIPDMVEIIFNPQS